ARVLHQVVQAPAVQVARGRLDLDYQVVAEMLAGYVAVGDAEAERDRRGSGARSGGDRHWLPLWIYLLDRGPVGGCAASLVAETEDPAQLSVRGPRALRALQALSLWT